MTGRKAVMKKGTDAVVLDTPIAYADQRNCTRCDGKQHLVGAYEGMGKYRCDICQLVVCFDLDAHPAEFITFRGLPQYYTKNIFGTDLSIEERRLP